MLYFYITDTLSTNRRPRRTFDEVDRTPSAARRSKKATGVPLPRHGPRNNTVGNLSPESTEALVYNAHEVNGMGTISTRVSDELEAELEAYLEDEKLDRSTAVRKLLSEGLEEWRRERALDRLAAGTVTFGKAAELAGMSVWDFARLAKERDVTWVADDHLDADLEAL